MAVTLGELAIELDARTNEFRSGLRSAQREIDRLDRGASTGTRNVGKSFASLGKTVLGVTTAVTALVTAVGGFLALRFGQGAIQAAAEYEKLGVTLKTLTGSAEGAKAVLNDVDELVLRTPFGLQELGNASKSVAVTFGENTAAVSEFTSRVADVAAGLGAPVEQFGENFTRAMAAGLGAADLFREKGLSKLILDITGLKDVADVGPKELAAAFRLLTEEGGLFFGAAAAQAETLDGAISNSKIAVDNFSRSFGQIIQPTVTDFLLNIFQPAMKALEALLKENREEIAGFAARSIPALLSALESAVGAINNGVRALGFMAKAWEGVLLVFEVVRSAVDLMIASWSQLIDTVRFVARNVTIGFDAIKAAARGDFSAARESLAQISESVKLFGEDSKENLGFVTEGFGRIREQFDKIAENQAGETFFAIADAMDAGAKSAFAFANGLGAIGAATEKVAPKGPGKADITDIFPEELDVNLPLPAAAEFKEMEAALDRLQGGPIKRFAEDFGSQLATSVEGGLSGVIDDLKSNLGSIFGDLGGALSEQLGGGALGGAVSSGLSVVGGLVTDALATSASKGFSKAAGNLSSAVESVEATRGIVAGPTSIGIAQVERGIGSAFEGSERELKRQTPLLAGILAALNGGAPSGVIAAVPSTQESDLATAGPSLI